MQNRNEAYFRQFLELLSDHYKKERSVNFYAHSLCITPKYLTTIIKCISGKPVSDWIDHFVLLEAQSLLKYTNMRRAGDLLPTQFPEPVVFRMLLQTPDRHVALAVQGAGVATTLPRIYSVPNSRSQTNRLRASMQAPTIPACCPSREGRIERCWFISRSEYL